MIAALHDFEGPIIGAINGHAITGGFELALACDVLIASTAAVFGDTHARVGIVPGWGLSQKLPRQIGISRAKELSFTGNFMDAGQAERWGLVNRVTEPDALLPTCRQLAQDMLSCDPASLRTYKQMIDRGYEQTFGEGMQLEQRMSREHLKAVPAGAVEARRAGIQQRGRRQQDGG
jgi:enoyl-CoA hydratase